MRTFKRILKRILGGLILLFVSASLSISVLMWVNIILTWVVGDEITHSDLAIIETMCLNLPLFLFCWYAFMSDWNIRKLRKLLGK